MTKKAGEMTNEEFNDQYDWYDLQSARQTYIAYRVEHASEQDVHNVRNILIRCAAAAVLGDKYVMYKERMTNDMLNLIHSSGFKTKPRHYASGQAHMIYGWADLPEAEDIQTKDWTG
jgi:IS1 family transposase